ncbi:MAG: 4Fe-4S dicluster domain-containing protein [Candidatus Bathyarchaeales archaeon]
MAEGKQEKAAAVESSKEITSRLGGETITFCYQCGTCASSCPVAKVTDRFNPRQIIRLALLGQREEVLINGAIWLCASCYNCQERCPQKVEIADIIYALRNIAISEGQIPNIYAEFANALINEGRIVPMSKFLEKKRAEYGLPPLKPSGIEALKKILSATGFDKLMAKKGEVQ